MRRYLFALRPRWLLLHLFTLAAAVTMILLGRWQLGVSNAKHFNVQNFGYALQWWLFTGCALLFWFRLMREAAARDGQLPVQSPQSAETEQAADEPVAYRRYVMPTTPAPTDPVHSAYNDYLAALADQDRQAGR